MKALSIRAPWWWWILYGGKDIENRSRRTHYRGPVLIHASTWWSAPRAILDNAAATDMAHRSGNTSLILDKSELNRIRAHSGHIVGVAEIVDCLEQPADFPIQAGQVWNLPGSPWHMPGQYGWKLANVRPIINPTPLKGALGLFETDYTVTHAENKLVLI